MAKKTYAEKLRDPRWQRKRLERLTASEWTCDICCTDDVTLNVHHKAYFKGREPWEYENCQLSVLCERCHKELHEDDPDLLAEVVSRLPLDGPNCRRDIGTLLAVMFYPNLTPKDKFAARVMRRMLSDGSSDELFKNWCRIYWEVIHKLATEKEGDEG